MWQFRGQSVVYSENSKIIKVGAVFRGSRIIPKWFTWEGRKYNVSSVDYIWEDKQGKEKIIRFSVSDGTNSYELAYNLARLNWSLEKVA
jgi:hypothetical protein